MPTFTPCAIPQAFSRRSFLQRHLALAAGMTLLPVTLQAEADGQLGSSVISCAGAYAGHLQGVCIDRLNHIYWSFTTTLVKTDLSGKVLMQIPVVTHHGAPCYKDGKIYVAVNLGKFNEAALSADSWIYVYKAEDLSFLRKRRVEEVIYGAGGIAYHNGRFLVIGGLPEGFEKKYLYEYDEELSLTRTITLKSGYTAKGIQTAAYNNGYWWFGCYGTPEILLKVDAQFKAISRFTFDCALGIIPVGRSFLVARGRTTCSEGRGCTGQLLPASMSKERGLTLPFNSPTP